MLITTRPNWIVPLFRQVGNLIQYKRFPRDYTWRDFIDLSSVIFDPTAINDELADHETRITTNEATLVTQASDISDAAAAAAAAQATADAAAAAAGGAANIYPQSYTFAPSAFHAVNGGFGAANYSNTLWLSTYWLMVGLNAEADITIPLKAGNYAIEMLWTKGANGGDVTAYLDGVSLGAAAGYNATNLPSTWSWIANGVTLGEHTLALKITNKQPASSGYTIAVSQITIHPNP